METCNRAKGVILTWTPFSNDKTITESIVKTY